MRRIFWTAAAMLALALLASCAGDRQAEPAVEGEKIAFDVSGMTCSGCEAGVRVALKRLDGVRQVDASYLESRVTVTYDPALVEPLRIEEAIEALGYDAELRAEPSQEKEGSL